MRQDADLEAIMASGKFSNQAEKYLFDVTHFYLDTYDMKEPQRQMFIMDTNTQDTPYQMINQLLAIERGTLESFVGLYSDEEEEEYEEHDCEDEEEEAESSEYICDAVRDYDKEYKEDYEKYVEYKKNFDEKYGHEDYEEFDFDE